MGRSPAGTLGWHYPGEPGGVHTRFSADTGLYDDGRPGDTRAIFHGAVAECASSGVHWPSMDEDPHGVKAALVARPEASRRAVYIPPGRPQSINPVLALFAPSPVLEPAVAPAIDMAHLRASGMGGGGWFASEFMVREDFEYTDCTEGLVPWEDWECDAKASEARSYVVAAFSALKGYYDSAVGHLARALEEVLREPPQDLGA